MAWLKNLKLKPKLLIAFGLCALIIAREVDRNLVNIQDLSTQTAAGANQTSASSHELSRLAISSNTLVGQFKL